MSKNEVQLAPLGDTSIKTLLDAGKALGSPQFPDRGLAPYAIVPPGYEMKVISRADLPPLDDHIRQNVRLDDAESFILYVKAFRTATTRILAASIDIAKVTASSAGGAKFTALLDYHEGGKEQKASRCAHVASYPVPLSLEFRVWLASNGKALSQTDFVEFIEANAADVVSPDSASLMEMALNFEAETNVNFQSKIDRVSGGRSLTFQETVDAGAPSVGRMKVPETLALRIPVFEGGKSYELKARLEYRASNGRLAVAYHLHRPHDAFRLAIKDLREEIATGLELEILTGDVLPAAQPSF